MCSHILQILRNMQLLRTDFFTLTAFHAVTGFSEVGCETVIISALRCPVLCAELLLIGIVQGEISGDGDVVGTAIHTVRTAGTGNGNAAVDDGYGLLNPFQFFFIQWLKSCI